MDTSKKPDIRSYCNPFKPRFSPEAQKEILTGTVYEEDKTGKVIDGLIRSVRKGTMVELADGFLLAPIKGRPSKRRAVMLERIDQIKEMGGFIRCLATGYQSNNRSQCNRMLLRAYEMMGRSGQGAPGKRKEGRPKSEYTETEMLIMEMQWHSKKNKNNLMRMAAIEKRLSKKPYKPTRLRQLFGPPGGHKDDKAT